MTSTDAWGFATGEPVTTPPGRSQVPAPTAEPGPAPAAEPDPAPHTTTEPPPARPVAAGRRSARREGNEPQRTARAALTRILEPGDETAGRWLREMGPVALWHALADDAADPPTGTTPAKIAGLRLRAARARPTADLDAITALGGRFLCPGDDEWPGQLDDLGDARPIGLWVRGAANLRLWALRSVAVVGARACTDYGAHLATTLSAGLADRGWTVVSGAAYGVDGAVHRGALAADGATIAVMACGVDHAYPRGHTELIGRIAEQGLVVAELPPGDHPTRSRFIQRNRVIAALTRGTVVVEAELRSGSLVTARQALALGRFTMGVPGPVTSSLSAGVHQLLRGEATVVTGADEVIELVGSIGDLAPEQQGPTRIRDLLDPVAARVLEALPARGGTDTGRLAEEAATPREVTQRKLFELLSLGFVQRCGDRWALARRAERTEGSRRGGT
ncbi:DNA processing protein [Streptomyces sp. 2224.1]|uniref:DNA-processing protein DprA n=1 Tax=unclassified Streptomyces TaxID=2593676 RepID=UPI000889270F|nr:MULTISPECIES: DNA-processing protein DprA [unclassified Streptomyces]PBC85333.1 DNA processing protein [Streptomyces sp. 2321.6]SDR17397.1 DNA processing protein [Streptomyces sp. KS_16]SEB49831.1 DNA processing protein [Streptomyces sp. 2224.1]SED64400.1 DNA processing protein [Streptomyces sp. 2133.1]SNC71447.1 DNA processing protein [Streptomyces sp. 2114.4]